MKISKISEDTGISRTTLTNLYYRRCTAISFEVLDKLCTYLNCGVEDIVEFKKDQFRFVSQIILDKRKEFLNVFRKYQKTQE